MKKKKEIPLVVLQIVEPYIKESNDLYQITETKESLMKFIDSDTESDFYFEIQDFEVQNNKSIVSIEFKPRNAQDLELVRVSGDVTNINTYFKKWITILDQYSKIEYEDPIIKANKERFIEKFKLVDEDAEFSSFNLEQQIFLENYLDKSKEKLAVLKNGKSENEKLEITELELEAEIIKTALTKESKQKIIKRLSKFWAKAQKIGLPIIKEIFVSTISELTKRLLIG
ncbi:hypothetical protein [Lutibacter sp. B1]|uniref:hypothetical protein n=1 Tax=Lutibacter sp. B1 TaxID=2725996 RepID=UPI001456FE83|nr:hypothetical protein [Lutibacter sp. B1]NLP59342.1 hypothetical protein [Lutibacter sp. B1]